MAKQNNKNAAHSDEAQEVSSPDVPPKQQNFEAGVNDPSPDQSNLSEQPPEDTEKLPAEGNSLPTEPLPISSEKKRRFKEWFGQHKKITIPVLLILIIGILAAIPFTRYALAGTVLRQKFTVKVLDAETNKPVSSADVTIGGRKIQTDGQGSAEITVRAGNDKLSVEKKYYRSAQQNVLVPIFKQKQPAVVKLKATGRQVPITIVNKISKKPVEGASITALGTKARTDKKGKAVLVLPAGKQTVEGKATTKGFNETKQALTVTTDEKANIISLTPTGTVYFLSDQNGTLDVVKANLDGSGRKVVVPGTGAEDKRATVLLASRDWKYLALLSRRDGGENAKLFLIDTASDKLTTIDEGLAGFSLAGWSDHRFVYIVNRQNVQYWQPNRQALKSFDADAKKISTIDQTGGVGDGTLYSYDEFGAPYILKNEIVYTKQWRSGIGAGAYPYQTFLLWKDGVRGRKAEVRSVRPDGSAARSVKSYALPADAQYDTVSLYTRAYEPQSLWVAADNNVIEEYEDGQIKPVSGVPKEEFWSKEYPTYLIAPSGTKTFWSELRDGKNTLLIGNDEGKGGREIAKLSDYASYGWYTDQYVLVTKKGSELYIMPAAGGEGLKIADYYKPGINFTGYGYGYGGL